MAARGITYSLGITLAVSCLIVGGVSTLAPAQPPGDVYESGPDPIAPQLSAQVAAGEAEDSVASQGSDAGKKDDKDDLDEMLNMDLKELSQVAVRSASPAMETQVSTVSRTASTVGRSPSAVYVLTNEMIRRSGARNIPEALRLVPGVQVAQVGKTIWAITIRGFNGIFSNKLLVQIDGRAVYTPGFGGVSWDQNQVLLEDVERIEIVRGPGATVWGSNAVNGVINIVTKSSIDTKGIYAHSGGGDQHRSFNAVRAGGQQGDLHWRIYGMQTDDGPSYWPWGGVPGMYPDAWDSFQYGQGGFRMDWTPTTCDTLTLQGDFMNAHETLQQLGWMGYIRDPEPVQSNNFVGRWTRKLSEESDWAVQLYYDGFKRDATGTARRISVVDTFDLDSQYHTKVGDRHDVIGGFGFRNYDSTMDASGAVLSFDPTRESFHIISYFLQDTIELRPQRTYLTAGCKFEHNNFTGFEYQPSIRLLVAPDDRTAMWGAVSRAIRTPSISERDISIFGGLVQGSRNLVSEDVMAYELGMRRQPTERLYWDLAVFFNRYDNLIGAYPLFPPPALATNIGRGDTYGYELVVTYEVNPDWHLRGAYSFLVEHLTYGPNGQPFYTPVGFNPRNQFFIQSGWDLSQTTTLDMIWRYVDNLPYGVPHYLVMDVRVAWQPQPNLELALVGQNLLDDHHPELRDFNGATEVPAGFYGMVSCRY